MEGTVLLAKLLALFTDRLNQELWDANDYLQEEVRALKQHLKNDPHESHISPTYSEMQDKPGHSKNRSVRKVSQLEEQSNNIS